jgi:hypothetical protein
MTTTHNTMSSHKEAVKTVADSIRHQMVNGEAKRSVIAFHRRAVKGTDHHGDIDVEAIYLAVKEGMM